MEPYDLFAQLIGIAAMTFNILSFQAKTKNEIIGMQFIGSSLFCFNFLLLKAYTGALLNGVAVLRAFVFLKKEKFKAQHPFWSVLFVTLFVTAYILTFAVFGKETTPFNFVLEFLPLVGMTATTLAFRSKNAKTVRLLSLINSPMWLIYNCINFAIGGIICEVVSLVSIFIGLLRYDLLSKSVPDKK